MSETIVAPGTALLPAARGVLRLSGPDSLQLVSALLQAPLPRRRGVHPLSLQLFDDTPPLPAWGLLFLAPHSYTGEDLVELHLPGGPALIERALECLLTAGAVLPGPGEFTRRAFLHGKLDLLQAEAVGALIAASAEGERRQAWDMAHSGLAAEVETVRAPLFALLSHIEAELDFSHHEIDLLDAETARGVLRRAREQVAVFLERERSGPALLRVCLEGPPNAGKSTLFNRLLGTDRALTSDRRGTTRDVVEDELQLPSLTVLLQDLAGWQTDQGALNQAAQERARRCLQAAELVVSVRPPECVQPFHAGGLPVSSKLDLPGSCARPGSLGVSAQSGLGIDALRRAIEERVARCSQTGRVLHRHREQLLRAEAALEQAERALAAELGPECLALDLRCAVQSLGELSGQDFAEDLLDRIFAGFCIGK